jgi:hypothetical protein
MPERGAKAPLFHSSTFSHGTETIAAFKISAFEGSVAAAAC